MVHQRHCHSRTLARAKAKLPRRLRGHQRSITLLVVVLIVRRRRIAVLRTKTVIDLVSHRCPPRDHPARRLADAQALEVLRDETAVAPRNASSVGPSQLCDGSFARPVRGRQQHLQRAPHPPAAVAAEPKQVEMCVRFRANAFHWHADHPNAGLARKSVPPLDPSLVGLAGQQRKDVAQRVHVQVTSVGRHPGDLPASLRSSGGCSDRVSRKAAAARRCSLEVKHVRDEFNVAKMGKYFGANGKAKPPKLLQLLLHRLVAAAAATTAAAGAAASAARSRGRPVAMVPASLG
mmetsp:Transcript_9822/g.38243  ORF Transcript_9822/g.38243 Transcript_9822/m.38243 type:complete len:291 (-) Transcript_9822:629-1501(-)